MLIASPRHTASDLALWRDLEEADLALTVLNSRVIEASREVIEFARRGSCWVGCSWGKDSVVLASLVALTATEVPVVYVRMRTRAGASRDNPDCFRVRDAFMASYSIEYHEREFVAEDSRHDEHWRAVSAEFGDRRITGLRADESKSRLLSIGSMGLSTAHSSRPIGRWRQRDVWAYTARHDLPVNPAYACLGGGRWPREHIRVHNLGGARGAGAGRAEWEREYYGDELRSLM